MFLPPRVPRVFRIVVVEGRKCEIAWKKNVKLESIILIVLLRVGHSRHTKMGNSKDFNGISSCRGELPSTHYQSRSLSMSSSLSIRLVVDADSVKTREMRHLAISH